MEPRTSTGEFEQGKKWYTRGKTPSSVQEKEEKKTDSLQGSVKKVQGDKWDITQGRGNEVDAGQDERLDDREPPDRCLLEKKVGPAAMACKNKHCDVVGVE